MRVLLSWKAVQYLWLISKRNWNLKYPKLLIGALHKIFTLEYWDIWKKMTWHTLSFLVEISYCEGLAFWYAWIFQDWKLVETALVCAQGTEVVTMLLLIKNINIFLVCTLKVLQRSVNNSMTGLCNISSSDKTKRSTAPIPQTIAAWDVFKIYVHLCNI